ncbi:MAG TPA: hypothetical protein VHO67_02970 [Polyangia bacterium]|nr:hypothetical protein [Polyangia bacterium]
MSDRALNTNDWSAVLRDAQTAEAAGRLDEAARLFARVRKLVPENILGLRGACDVALSMQRAGQLTSSREPCHRAFLFGAKPEDMYREVASVMHEPTAPSLDTTVLMAFAADAAVHRGGGEPWGYLARCEMGRRLGLADVLEGCLADLQRIAPNAPETKQMLATATPHPSLWTWALRLLLLLAPLATAAHFLLLRSRRRARPLVTGKTATAFFVLAAVCATAGAARGALVEKNGHPEMENDQISIFPIDDKSPEASVPPVAQQNEKPLQFGYFLQDLAAKVERAKKNNDVPAQIRYYRAIAKAAPNSPYGPRKLCDVLQESGDIDGAIVACRTATVIEGTTVGDFRHLIDVIMSKPGKIAPDLQKEAYDAVEHIEKEAQLGALTDVIRCDAALRFEDWGTLAVCSERLAQHAPNDAKTVSFQWALAVHEHDKQKADALVDRARRLGMEPAGIQKMEATNRSIGRTALVRLLFVLAVMGLAVGVWWFGGKKLLTRRNAGA